MSAMDLNAMEFFDLVQSGDCAKVRAALGADPMLAKARDAQGATALHRAALAGDRETSVALLEAGANVNALDGRFGATPAGWAIEHFREHGGLLAIEIDDAKFAIERGDAVWLRRLLERFPALKTARHEAGTLLSDLARAGGNRDIADLF